MYPSVAQEVNAGGTGMLDLIINICFNGEEAAQIWKRFNIVQDRPVDLKGGGDVPLTRHRLVKDLGLFDFDGQA